MIKDKLNFQKNTIELLEQGCTLFLETQKHRKLKVVLIKEGETKT